MRTEFLRISVLRVASGSRVKLASRKVLYSTDRSKVDYILNRKKNATSSKRAFCTKTNSLHNIMFVIQFHAFDTSLCRKHLSNTCTNKWPNGQIYDLHIFA